LGRSDFELGRDFCAAQGTREQRLADQLENYILTRKNILIAGGTGSGKTMMLNALGKFIPPDERIPSSKTRLKLHGPRNLVRFEARQAAIHTMTR